MNSKLFVNLTRQFLRFLEELSPEEMAAIESHERKIEITLSGSKSQCGKQTKISPEEFDKLAVALKSADTVEQAKTLLGELKREQLTKLCRLLDLPVEKSDKIEQVKEKVAQATVGFRLHSKAIQG